MKMTGDTLGRCFFGNNGFLLLCVFLLAIMYVLDPSSCNNAPYRPWCLR